MQAHNPTIATTSRVRVAMEVGKPDWLQRLYQWFMSLSAPRRDIAPASPYGTWDAKRERFRAFRAEAAADMIAQERGGEWSTRLYSGSI